MFLLTVPERWISLLLTSSCWRRTFWRPHIRICILALGILEETHFVAFGDAWNMLLRFLLIALFRESGRGTAPWTVSDTLARHWLRVVEVASNVCWARCFNFVLTRATSTETAEELWLCWVISQITLPFFVWILPLQVFLFSQRQNTIVLSVLLCLSKTYR